jgi:hypothetical protein
LLLVASVTWSLTEFPRWLTVVIALDGLLNLTGDIFGIVTGEQLPVAIFIFPLLLLMVVFFGVAVVFWRAVKTP